jgi:hypothetical protein
MLISTDFDTQSASIDGEQRRSNSKHPGFNQHYTITA